jgi:hypothetical protein
MDIRCLFGCHDYLEHRRCDVFVTNTWSYTVIDGTCRRCRKVTLAATKEIEYKEQKRKRALEKLSKQNKLDAELEEEFNRRMNFHGR